jgi:hypothetical protein
LRRGVDCAEGWVFNSRSLLVGLRRCKKEPMTNTQKQRSTLESISLGPGGADTAHPRQRSAPASPHPATPTPSPARWPATRRPTSRTRLPPAAPRASAWGREGPTQRAPGKRARPPAHTPPRQRLAPRAGLPPAAPPHAPACLQQHQRHQPGAGRGRRSAPQAKERARQPS